MVMKNYTIEKLSKSPALRLGLYKWMLDEWKKPSDFETLRGFCHQLYYKLRLDIFNKSCFEKTLPELFNQRNTCELNGYHYHRKGDHPQGRIDRQKALEKAIEEVEPKTKLYDCRNYHRC